MIESWSIYNLNTRKETEKRFFEIRNHETNYSYTIHSSLLGHKEELVPFYKLTA